MTHLRPVWQIKLLAFVNQYTQSYKKFKTLFIYTRVHKFKKSKIFFNKFFWRKSLQTHQGCIYLFKNTVKAVMLYNIIPF